MNILITLGPTQEPIDAVRYITNASSGRFGVLLAREAINRGYETTLIAGPIHIPTPREAKVYRVRTADEMTDKTLTELSKAKSGRGYDVFISTAAIADFTPDVSCDSYEGKIKSGGELVILLKPTRKLTRMVRQKFPGVFIVAFKAEYGVSVAELTGSAKSKMENENLDMIIANDIKKNRFGSETTEVYVINKNEIINIDNRIPNKKFINKKHEKFKNHTNDKQVGAVHIPSNSKKIIARKIWDIIDERLSA